MESGKLLLCLLFPEHLITKDLVDTKGVKFISLKELDYNMFH